MPSHSFVLWARLGYLYSAGNTIGRLLSFANASMTCACESVLMVVPMDMKKLSHQSVYASYLVPYANCVPKCCSRTCHVLSQCSHHAIWTWAESNDVRCAEYKANDETDGYSDMLEEGSWSSLWKVELITSAHHRAHFNCGDQLEISLNSRLGSVRLSNVEGPVAPPWAVEGTGGISM